MLQEQDCLLATGIISFLSKRTDATKGGSKSGIVSLPFPKLLIEAWGQLDAYHLPMPGVHWDVFLWQKAGKSGSLANAARWHYWMIFF